MNQQVIEGVNSKQSLTIFDGVKVEPSRDSISLSMDDAGFLTGSHFISNREQIEIYDRLWDQFNRWMSRASEILNWMYEDVDLFSCLRKSLFEYLYPLFLRVELKKRAENSGLYTDIRVRGTSADDLEKYPNLVIVDNYRMKPDSFYSRKPGVVCLKGISLRSLSERNILINADTKKNLQLASEKGPRNCVWMLNSYSFSTAAHLMRLGFAVSLPAYGEENRVSATLLNNAQWDSLYKSIPKEFVPDIFFDKTRQLTWKYLPRLISEIRNFKKITGSMKIGEKEFWLDEDITPIKNALTQYCTKHHIKSYVECHGAPAHQSAYLPVTADVLFAWDSGMKQKLVDWGSPEGKISVRPTKRYQPYSAITKPEARQEIIKRHNLDSSKKLALLGFMPIKKSRNFNAPEMKIAINMALKPFLDNSSCNSILKIHPGDDYLQDLKEMCAGSDIRIVTDGDAYLLARASDILITYQSTFAVDAVALETPAVLLYPDSYRMLSEYRSLGAFHEASSREQYDEILESFFSNRIGEACGAEKLRKIMGLTGNSNRMKERL